MSEKKIELILDLHGSERDTSEGYEWTAGADALILDPCRCGVEEFQQMPVDKAVVVAGDPEKNLDWLQTDFCRWVGDGGLDNLARIRDRWPEQEWIPRLTVYRPEVSYRFSGQSLGEGFSFYMPDTSAINGCRVVDGDAPLAEEVTRAVTLGFSTLWLHSGDADSKAMGLDIEMLDKVQGGPLDIWISGGVASSEHLRNLAKTDGAAAVVVNERLVRETGIDPLLQALAPEVVIPEAVPVHFEPSPAKTG